MSAPAPSAALDVDEEAEAAQAAQADHAAAEGVEASGDVGSKSTLREMLLSTEPSKPLEEVEAPYDPEAGGMTRIYRGIQKMTGIDGLPAGADLAFGAVEMFVDLEGGETSQQSDESADSPDNEAVI